MHNEELRNLYTPPKEDPMDGACSTHGRRQEMYNNFGHKTQREKTTSKTKAYMRR